MTLPGTITAAAAAAQREHSLWRTEIVDTIRLAWPMALTQLGQIAMMTTDLALIGRLGDGAVAAVSLAHLILFVGFVFGMGLVSAATLAAQAFGARAAHGAALAAHGLAGGGDPRRADQCISSGARTS
jgi:MATE family multidrug resistance protein